MLESGAKPVFLMACAANVVFAITGGLTVDNQAPHLFALLAGPLAFTAAAVVGLSLLFDANEGMHRGWIKATLVFLVLGPLAFWFLQWPAVASLLCLDCTIDPAFGMRARGDIVQSQLAMIAVALAALFCAARATTTFLEELAD